MLLIIRGLADYNLGSRLRLSLTRLLSLAGTLGSHLAGTIVEIVTVEFGLFI